MEVVEFGVRIYYKNSHGKYEELLGINKVTISAKMNSYEIVLKIRVATKSFYTNLIQTPLKVRMAPCAYSGALFYVDEILGVDENFKEIIAKNTLSRLKKTYAPNLMPHSIYELLAQASFLNDGAFDLVGENFDISFVEDEQSVGDYLSKKLKDIGAFFYISKNGLLTVNSEFFEKSPTIINLTQADLIELSANEIKNEPIGSIIYNLEKNDDLYAVSSLNLHVDESPQSVSPKKELSWENEAGERFVITPVTSVARLYHSPAGEVKLNVESSVIRDYRTVEEFDCDGEDFIQTAGFIKKLRAVSLNNNPKVVIKTGEPINDGSYYVNNTNIIVFNEPLYGNLKISYETDINRFILQPSQTPTYKMIKASHFDSFLEFKHEWVVKDFHPLPFNERLSVIKEFNIDPNDISKVGLKLAGQNIAVDEFGEFELKFEDYGVWAVELFLEGVFSKKLFIRYFANSYEKDFNEVIGNKKNGA